MIDNMSPHSIHPHRLSLPDLSQPVQIAPAPFGPELDHGIRNGFNQSPSDLTIPITPMMSSIPHMDTFVNLTGNPYEHDTDPPFLTMGSNPTSLMDFDPSAMLPDFMSTPSLVQDAADQFMFQGKNGMQTPQFPTHIQDAASQLRSRFELDSPMRHGAFGAPVGLSPSNSSTSSGLQEPEAVLAAHHAWPFFQCNRAEKFSFFPPKTAAIYLEGLAQTLRNQATWQAWTAQLDESNLEIATERKILTEPLKGWPREKLLAITQSFLHKALDIHKSDHTGREDSPASPDSHRDHFLMLPPPDVLQYFLRSYIVRYEPYYSSVAGGIFDPNSLMQATNSKAASLLLLLMVASGASSTPTVEARYVTSGLTEACRISLFDTIEKDVMQARDVLILRSALLFTCLAAWSGDKWHMDVSLMFPLPSITY